MLMVEMMATAAMKAMTMMTKAGSDVGDGEDGGGDDTCDGGGDCG